MPLGWLKACLLKFDCFYYRYINGSFAFSPSSIYILIIRNRQIAYVLGSLRTIEILAVVPVTADAS